MGNDPANQFHQRKLGVATLLHALTKKREIRNWSIINQSNGNHGDVINECLTHTFFRVARAETPSKEWL